MARFRFDAHLKHADRLFRENYDGNNAAIASSLTRSTIRELIEYKYMETPWASGELIYIDTGHHEGATSVDWFEERDVFEPGSTFVADDAPAPMADIAGEQHTNRAHTMKCGFKYDLQELLSYEMQGLSGDLPGSKGRSARRLHDTDFNTAVMSGVPKLSITGVLNQPGSLQLQAGVATGTTADWVGTASPQQVVDSFEAVFSAIDDASGGTIKPDTVVFPGKVGRVLRRQNSLANGDSIMKWLVDSFPEITKWKIDPRMNTAGLGGTAAVLAYKRDRDHLRAITPMYLRPMPIFIRGGRTEQEFRSRFAGIFCPFPTSIAVLSGV